MARVVLVALQIWCVPYISNAGIWMRSIFLSLQAFERLAGLIKESLWKKLNGALAAIKIVSRKYLLILGFHQNILKASTMKWMFPQIISAKKAKNEWKPVLLFFFFWHVITRFIPIQQCLKYSKPNCWFCHQIHGFVIFEFIFLLGFVFHLRWETGKLVTWKVVLEVGFSTVT